MVLLEGLSSKLPALIDAAFGLMIAFINGLADAIEKNTPIVLAAIIKLLLAIPKALLNMQVNMISSFFKMGSQHRTRFNKRRKEYD